MNAAKNLLDALGKQLGSTLQLENGVCALFDNDREVVIIEVPSAGDVVILHCKLPLRPDPGLHERLLRLNFDAAAMNSCWLALDERSQVRLCSELPLDGLGEVAFVQWVQGFVQQTHDVPRLLRTHTVSGAARRAV